MIRYSAKHLLRAGRQLLAGPRAMVLMYHRVASPEIDPWQLSVPAARFDDQIQALLRAYEVVPLRAVPERVASGRADKPIIAITFDDGYRDNLTAGQPILERHGCPATIFIATGFTGSLLPFWWDELAALILTGQLPATVALPTSAGEVRWAAPRFGELGHDERLRLLLMIWERLRLLGMTERQHAMTELASMFRREREAPEDALPMNERDIRALRNSLFDIGAHTVTHPPLTALANPSKRREIEESRSACEAIIGRPVDLLAYPFGDFDSTCRAAAEAEGIRVAVTTEEAAFGRRGDPLAIPRLQVRPTWTGLELVERINALAAS